MRATKPMRSSSSTRPRTKWWAGLRWAASDAEFSQSGTLGYWMGAPHAGKGRMTRAVAATVEFAFVKLRLHRVEAACIPDNAPSIALLERERIPARGIRARLPQNRRRLARSCSFRAGRKRLAGETDGVKICLSVACATRIRPFRPETPRRLPARTLARSVNPRADRYPARARPCGFSTGVRGSICQGFARFRRHRPHSGR